MKESFLKFLEEHERKLEDLITEDVSEEMEDFMEDNSEEPVIVKKTVSPRIIPKPKIVPKKIVKESNSFSFCSSCGNKLPSGINGKYCPFCGQATLMTTNAVTKTATKISRVSETIDYASNLLDDEPLQQSRLVEYLEKNPVVNPISQMLKNNQNVGESAMDRASDLLDGVPEVGQVQLLEMPDFSKFMIQKEEIKTIQENINTPMMSDIVIDDPLVISQMTQLGLI